MLSDDQPPHVPAIATTIELPSCGRVLEPLFVHVYEIIRAQLSHTGQDLRGRIINTRDGQVTLEFENEHGGDDASTFDGIMTHHDRFHTSYFTVMSLANLYTSKGAVNPVFARAVRFPTAAYLHIHKLALILPPAQEQYVMMKCVLAALSNGGVVYSTLVPPEIRIGTATVHSFRGPREYQELASPHDSVTRLVGRLALAGDAHTGPIDYPKRLYGEDVYYWKRLYGEDVYYVDAWHTLCTFENIDCHVYSLLLLVAQMQTVAKQAVESLDMLPLFDDKVVTQTNEILGALGTLPDKGLDRETHEFAAEQRSHVDVDYSRHTEPLGTLYSFEHAMSVPRSHKSHVYEASPLTMPNLDVISAELEADVRRHVAAMAALGPAVGRDFPSRREVQVNTWPWQFKNVPYLGHKLPEVSAIHHIKRGLMEKYDLTPSMGVALYAVLYHIKATRSVCEPLTIVQHGKGAFVRVPRWFPCAARVLPENSETVTFMPCVAAVVSVISGKPSPDPRHQLVRHENSLLELYRIRYHVALSAAWFKSHSKSGNMPVVFFPSTNMDSPRILTLADAPDSVNFHLTVDLRESFVPCVVDATALHSFLLSNAWLDAFYADILKDRSLFDVMRSWGVPFQLPAM